MSNSDYFHKRQTYAVSRSSKQKSGGNAVGLFLILILVLAIGVFVFFKAKAPDLQDVNPNLTASGLSLGQEISLQGTLTENGDNIVSTHTLTANDGNLYAVKSSVVNLNNYSGIVSIKGKVDKFYQKSPIIEIYEIIGVQTSDNDSNILGDASAGVYIPEVGIQLLPAFGDNFVLLTDGSNGQIKFQDINGNAEYTINIFKCNTANAETNCAQLQKTFSDGSSRSFSDGYGNVYYKSAMTNSRFTTYGGRWGLIINDAPEEVVQKVKSTIILSNAKVMDQRTKSFSTSICQKDNEKLLSIDKTTFTLKDDGLVAIINGKSTNYEVSCSVRVNFSAPGKGELISFSVGKDIAIQTGATDQGDSLLNSGGQTASTNSPQAVTSQLARNPDAVQFKLSPDKGLTYNAVSRGYSVKFPSPSISYSSSIISEDFDQVGLKCGNLIKVVEYVRADQKENNPDIEIYDCIAKNEVKTPGENYFVITAVGRTFIIKINNPARIDFAKNLTFSEISS